MDIREIADLLHIEEKTRNHPNLKAMHDAAMRALEGHNATHLAQPQDLAPETHPVRLQAEQEPGAEHLHDDEIEEEELEDGEVEPDDEIEPGTTSTVSTGRR